MDVVGLIGVSVCAPSGTLSSLPSRVAATVGCTVLDDPVGAYVGG